MVSSEGFLWGSNLGRASCSGRGDSGSMALFSWMELTTFSRSMGVQCFPRAWLLAESWRWRLGRDMGGCDRVVAAMALSGLESSEATLDDNSGRSASVAARRLSKDQRGGKVRSGA